jgi:hypothetical protein
MPRVEYIPRVEVLRFARECERVLALVKENHLSQSERAVLESYVQALRSLVADRGRRRPAA